MAALTDGIYAIAVTLLVLELRLPEHIEPGELGPAILRLGTHYVVYACAFILLLGGWLQHRRADEALIGIDHYGTLLHLCATAGFILTPFLAILFAHAVGNDADLISAIRFMSITLMVAMLFWAAFYTYAKRRKLFRTDLDSAVFTATYRLTLMAWVIPATSWVLSFLVDPWLALFPIFLYYALALFPYESHRRRDPGTE